MKRIQSVGIVGMGALGLLYADIMTQNLGDGHVAFLMDEERLQRHSKEVFTINGREVRFPMSCMKCGEAQPLDLLIVAVKYPGLEGAMEVMAPAVGEDTIIISLLNGISSEEIIARHFGNSHVLHVVAQGMDAMRFGPALTYSRKGQLCVGTDSPEKRAKLDALEEFLRRSGVDFVEEQDIRRRIWGKFMLNVGINQTCMVYGVGYGKALEKGSAEAMTFIGAMREVILLSRCEGVDLDEKDLEQYVRIVESLDPEATPSMGQDRLNRKASEVESFAGTGIRLAKKHGVPVPANEFLYARVKEIEAGY